MEDSCATLVVGLVVLLTFAMVSAVLGLLSMTNSIIANIPK